MNKELTPLEALEKIRSHNYHECSKKECLNIIEITLKRNTVLQHLCEIQTSVNRINEKKLKALEIIKKHKLLNYVLKNNKCASMYHLNDEELNFLKEVLL